MYSVHVSSTKDRELPPPELGPGLNWDRLTEVLLREVSADAAALLAEPVRDAARGQTNWHITAREDPKPLSALSDEERDKLLSRLNDRRREIERFAASVEAEGGDANLRLAAALRAVLTVPDERQHIWSADGKPVLTAWGRKPAGRQAPEPKLFRRQAGPPPQTAPAAASIHGTGHLAPPSAANGPTRDAPPPPIEPTPGLPPAAGKSTIWPAALLWLLFVLLVGGAYYALLPACGLQLGWLGLHADRCDFERSSELAALEMRNSALREAIAEAELRVAQNRGACLAPPQRSGLLDKAPVTPPPQPQRTGERDDPGPQPRLDSKEADLRRAKANGTHGKLDITLVWNGREDLDLHVYCPGGHIYFNARSACGGTLEIDRNSSLAKAEENPLEHVTWRDEAPAGEYRVEVILFDRFNLPVRPIPFTVVVRDSAGDHTYSGEVTRLKEPVTAASFTR